MCAADNYLYPNFSNYPMDKYKLAGWMLICYILLSIAMFFPLFRITETAFGYADLWIATIISLLSFIPAIFIWIAYWQIFKKEKIELLRIAVIFTIVISILTFIVFLIILFGLPFGEIPEAIKIYNYATAPFIGIAALLYGIAYLKLKKIPIAKALGIVTIIAGVMYLSVFLTDLGTLFVFASLIMEIIFFFQASKVYGQNAVKG
jgi:hypothetical protein